MVEVYPHTKLDGNRKNFLWTYGRTDVRTDGRTDGRTEGRTHLSSNLLGHRRGDDLKSGGWWRWALVSPDGVAPSQMVRVSASVNLPLHHKVPKKLSSSTGSTGWSWKRAVKRLWFSGTTRVIWRQKRTPWTLWCTGRLTEADTLTIQSNQFLSPPSPNVYIRQTKTELNLAR